MLQHSELNTCDKLQSGVDASSKIWLILRASKGLHELLVSNRSNLQSRFQITNVLIGDNFDIGWGVKIVIIENYF